jgi:hypothetical protein
MSENIAVSTGVLLHGVDSNGNIQPLKVNSDGSVISNSLPINTAFLTPGNTIQSGIDALWNANGWNSVPASSAPSSTGLGWYELTFSANLINSKQINFVSTYGANGLYKIYKFANSPTADSDPIYEVQIGADLPTTIANFKAKVLAVENVDISSWFLANGTTMIIPGDVTVAGPGVNPARVPYTTPRYGNSSTTPPTMCLFVPAGTYVENLTLHTGNLVIMALGAVNITGTVTAELHTIADTMYTQPWVAWGQSTITGQGGTITASGTKSTGVSGIN